MQKNLSFSNLVVGGLVLCTLLSSNIAAASTQIYNLNIPGVSGWQTVTYDTTHPYWFSAIQAIERAGMRYASNPHSPNYDGQLMSRPIDFQIVNKSKVAAPQQIPLASEYVHVNGPGEDIVLIYNPNSPVSASVDNPTSAEHVLAAPVNPNASYAPPNPILLDEMIHHEVGHIRWQMLCGFTRKVWKDVWQLSQEVWILYLQPMVPYSYENALGQTSTGNYFNLSLEEAFAAAWARYYTDQPLDELLQEFFLNLEKTTDRCNKSNTASN